LGIISATILTSGNDLLFTKSNRFNLVYLFIATFIVVSFVSRTVLLSYSFEHVSFSVLEMLKVYGIGLFYDFVAAAYYVVPFVVYLILVPNKIFNSRLHHLLSIAIFFGFVYSVVFNAFSEWFFWDEFGKRFNFIAVDYLVYTHEVINNILESYPVPLLLALVFLLTIALFAFYIKKTHALKSTFNAEKGFVSRLKEGGIFLVLPLIFFNLLTQQNLTAAFSNKFNAELSKNGLYSLFSAFRNNTLDYDDFYLTQDTDKVLKNLRKLQSRRNAQFVNDDLRDITRHYTAEGEEKHYNVILIMMESLSASYMGSYGNPKNLTPEMDKTIKQSLFFNNLYATGTRTVRGMEAVALSIPPTPGRSIVKRPNNHNLSSVGFVFKEKGYDNKFIYGGHGYFDNMNDFFSHNGFNIVDRSDFAKEEITFANVWGVCDTDLFDKALKEADRSFADNKPFFSFVMTTSNHRPFTFPREKMSQPGLKGRDSGVNYSDYAIKKLLEDAASKPWFDNTLFVIVADHNGGSSGEVDVPLFRYLIPAFVYAPKIIGPATVSKLSSQIDLMPTVMALMNWDYEGKFYGNNILADDFREQDFVGNYQKLGFYRDNRFTILSPDETAKSLEVVEMELDDVKYKEIENNSSDIDDAITYYQSASYLYKQNLTRYKKEL
jgi:phosphoglycerol transferase MdoB-like AlkP superfamily enzyme